MHIAIIISVAEIELKMCRLLDVAGVGRNIAEAMHVKSHQ